LWENAVCAELFDFAIDEKRIAGLDVFVEEFFKEADTNKDGVISLDEFRVVASKYAKVVADHKLKILAFQTGGHVGSFAKVDEGKIKKKVSKVEYDFYKSVSEKYPELIPFIPKFYGTLEEEGKCWVVMEDLTAGMSKPCVMDIKMGTTSAGEDADPVKRAEMEKKDNESTTVALGMRITGMKVYKADKGEFQQFSKSWGRKVTPETMKDALATYFSDGIKLRKDILRLFFEKLEPINKWFENQFKLRFYSSSLLFVYEGDTSREPVVKLRMIDFAHVFPINDGGKDDGYLCGLKNLKKYLHELE